MTCGIIKHAYVHAYAIIPLPRVFFTCGYYGYANEIEIINSHKKILIEVEKQLVCSQHGAQWCFCISYIENSPPPQGKKEKTDYKNVLKPHEFEFFSTLRKVRKALAEADGIPACAVFIDEELAGIARTEELTIQDIQRIKGIGTKKVEEYSEKIINGFQKPCFERFQVFDSYACRKGKGTYAALERASAYQKKFACFLKLDVRKYFDTLSHAYLKEKLKRLYKDKALLAVFNKIINSYCVFPCKGVPIGNLTSQYFANHALAYADHFVKEKLQVKGYARYMDVWRSL